MGVEAGELLLDLSFILLKFLFRCAILTGTSISIGSRFEPFFGSSHMAGFNLLSDIRLGGDLVLPSNDPNRILSRAALLP